MAPPPSSADEPVGVPLNPALQDLHHGGFKLALLTVWALVSFGAGYFASDLQSPVAGWPLSYWIGAQGGILVFIALAWIYCAGMAWLERRSGGATHASEAVGAVPPHG